MPNTGPNNDRERRDYPGPKVNFKNTKDPQKDDTYKGGSMTDRFRNWVTGGASDTLKKAAEKK
jgi:hypothetical protein